MNTSLKTYFKNSFLSSLDTERNTEYRLLSDGSTAKISKEELPVISVVMPSFNQEKFIERSILSVFNQDYPNIEFIIIDGGSQDGTTDIIKKHQNLISYWVSESDQGQSDALNKGFARANGDICCWLNSDDIYLPGAFRKIVSAFYGHPMKSIIFGDWLSINADDDVLDYNHAFDFNLNHFKYEGFHLNAQAMFWRANVHKAFGGFDLSLHNTMDYQMILDFGIHQGQSAFLRLPLALGAFRRYEGQKTSGFTTRVAQEHQRIAQRYGYDDKYTRIGKVKRLLYRFRRAFWYLRRGGVRLVSQRLLEAYAHAIRT